MKTRSRVIPAKKAETVDESLLSVNVDYLNKNVSVMLGTATDDGLVTSHRVVSLYGDQFEMLMEKNPSWAPGKKEGEFTTTELFGLIDHLNL